jgi:hypothetical protein
MTPLSSALENHRGCSRLAAPKYHRPTPTDVAADENRRGRVREPKPPARRTLTDEVRPRIPDRGNAHKGKDARRATAEARDSWTAHRCRKRPDD